MKRSGPQMQAAVDYVTRNPGAVMLDVAKHLHIGARKGTNNACGYNPIHRAVKAGLIVRAPGARKGSFVLFTPRDLVDA